MMKRKLLSMLLLAAICTMVSAQDLDEKYATDLLKPGTEAPDFTLRPLDERPDSQLSDLRGSYVLLDFWASWCPDCRKDVPQMKEINERYRGKLLILGVSMDTDKDALQRFIKAHKLDWRHSAELKKWKKESTVDRLYHVNWIPTMYLLDPKGRVVLATVMMDKLKAKLAELDQKGLLQPAGASLK